jgi:type II secretory ATPase GspE/PulE/Tfp pilus assembly ATPase PilB-like protein
MAPPPVAHTLRRSLLIKVISKPTPSREDVDSVIELTSSKVVEALQAQSMTLYLVEGNDIVFKHIYYSPTLWAGSPGREAEFKATAEKLLALKLPLGTGNVGKVIATGEPLFFNSSGPDAASLKRMNTGFEVRSMLTVPLKTSIVIGAIQVLNKEPAAGTNGEFTESDLKLLGEVAEYSASLIQRMLDPKFQLNAEDTAKFISRLTDHELVTSENDIEIDDKLIEVVGEPVIRREQILPHRRISPNSVAVLMPNPLDYAKREAFQQATELYIDEIRVAPAPLIELLVKKFFKSDPAATRDGEVDISSVAEVITSAYSGNDGEIKAEDLESEESAPIIQLTNRIIEDAYICGASDIHIEPMGEGPPRALPRGRPLREKLRLPKQVSNALVTRLKIMCNLDIAERRLPQDGRIVFKKYTKKNIDIDLRVATGPMNHGEKVVMRILDKQKSTLPLPALGFSRGKPAKNIARCIQPALRHDPALRPHRLGQVHDALLRPRGGQHPDVNIQTAEDPIEYTLAGINQMQMSRQIGLTFARALRCYLRMDPDIILVGEIRDEETAGIAVEAALTGHLLVSTLHTNDAPSTVSRLTEMGIEPFNISASLICVCAQRLMRRVCKNCKVNPTTPEGPGEKDILEKALGWRGDHLQGQSPRLSQVRRHRLQGPRGHPRAHDQQRVELTAAINKEVEVAELKRIAMRNGMKTLHQDSMLKVKEGVTTIEDALANVRPT